MSTDEVRTLSNQLKELKDLLVNHINTFNEHVVKSDAHISKMEPIVERIAQLTTVGDVVSFTEKFKSWVIWWAGLLTPLAVIGGFILLIIKFLLPQGSIIINKTSLNKNDVQEVVNQELDSREFEIIK